MINIAGTNELKKFIGKSIILNRTTESYYQQVYLLQPGQYIVEIYDGGLFVLFKQKTGWYTLNYQLDNKWYCPNDNCDYEMELI